MEKKLSLTKKQIYRKYKHSYEFKNPYGSPSKNKKEFRKSQIKFVKNEDIYVSKAIQISKNHEPRDCYLFIDDINRQVVQANPSENSFKYVSTRTFYNEEYERFKRPAKT